MFKKQTFFKVTGTIFGLVAIMHLLRLVYGWNAQIGSFTVPLWLSGVGLIVAGVLSYDAFKY